MRFIVDTWIAWFSDPADLVRSLKRRPPIRVLTIYQDTDGRFVLEGI